MNIEREKELHSQIEGLRSELEREYERKWVLELALRELIDAADAMTKGDASVGTFLQLNQSLGRARAALAKAEPHDT